VSDKGEAQPGETQADESWPSEPDESTAALLAQIYGADGPPDMAALAGPLHWPSIPSADIIEEWAELRGWVEALVGRFPHLDHHYIPACWWRHNGHVEALSALRDHERVSYADVSPGTAAVQWQWAMGLVEGRLKEWTSLAGCGAAHREQPGGLRPPDAEEWEGWVKADQRRRDVSAIGEAANDEATS